MPTESSADTDIDTDDTLTMGCEDPCEDCRGGGGGCSSNTTTTTTTSSSNSGSTSPNKEKHRLIDIEDYEKELAKLRARTKELEEAMARSKSKADTTTTTTQPPPLRSTDWFHRKSDLGMSALYVERYLNMGFSREELMSGKPIIGIAQSGSDISPVRMDTFSLLFFPLHDVASPVCVHFSLTH